MRRHLMLIAGGCIAALIAGVTVHAQWGRPSHPSRGVCFFEHPDYEGRYFCAAVGRHAAMVPIDANDKISSMMIYGSVEVTVFKDRDYSGPSHRFTSSMSNLRFAGWGDRISSYRVEERSRGGGWGGYGGGGWDGGGSGHSDGWGGAYGGGSRSNWDKHDGGRWTYAEAESMVRRAYRSVFKRDPDPGARSWIDAVMKNNWSQSELERQLMQSPEYRNRR